MNTDHSASLGKTTTWAYLDLKTEGVDGTCACALEDFFEGVRVDLQVILDKFGK